MWNIFLAFCFGAAFGYKSNEEPREFNTGGPDFVPHLVEQRADGGQEWGIVDVRPDAHLFYWFYLTTNSAGPLNSPLVLWLQGGPGGSSTGYGNFELIGPVDVNLDPRNTTWVQSANVLFVDNPVGAGYSWCDNDDCFTRDGAEIADDMSTFLKVFMTINPEFRTNEFFIFGQSYGGKMAATIARRLYNDIQAGDLTMNLAGVAMGGSWVSPVDSTVSWGEFLYWMATLDENGMDATNQVAQSCADAAANENWLLATQLWALTEQVLWSHSNYVDFYNILKFVTVDEYRRAHNADSPFGDKYDLTLGPLATDPLYDLMNGPVREYLGIIPANVTWDGQSDDCFYYQEGDFMKPVIDDVSWLLNNTDLSVVVYEGQLDLICDTMGALVWVSKITWPDIDNYYSAERFAFTDSEGQTDMFVKAYEKFKFYWMLRAGHSVPKDMPYAALRMLNRILNNQDQ